MIDDRNPVVLSFADALTCVLGASIALFLIFVTLVKVAPPSIDERRADPTLTERVGHFAGTGASDVVILAVSADCVALHDLKMSPEPAMSWTAQPDRNNDTCGRLFLIDETDTLTLGELRLATRRTKPFDLVLVVGAKRWPAEPLRIKPGTSCRADGRIATFSVRRTPPLIADRCTP